MKLIGKLAIGALCASSLLWAHFSLAQTADLEVSGWIPYWMENEGVRDAKLHLDDLDVLHPFVYSVKENGKLASLGNLNKSNWKSLIRNAKRDDIEVIPTIMWSDAGNMEKILSNSRSRKAHIKAITDMVKKGKHDGVDIDYEGKLAETKDHFSKFLIELKKALGNKILVCTIEPRTPPDSLYAVLPQSIGYANDYDVIAKYCDRVNIMAYDQQRADIKLNAARMGAPYMPVADIEWVKKVVDLAVQTIPREKILLGVPTYGREYVVTVSPNWFQGYTRVQAVNHDVAIEMAKKAGVTPSRNSAGELSFTYLPSIPALNSPNTVPIPGNTPSGNVIAARSLAYANATGETISFYVVWWSDAEAIKQKVDLAKSMGLRGVAIFKIDSGEDQALWDVI